jgi:hypothetical protein
MRQAEAPRAGQDSVIRPPTISSLMDSLDFQLPDTAEFSEKKYKVSFRPDYVAQPTIGYTRDNFGNGVYGGSAIALSDMLGDHTSFAFINGRITEAQLAAYYITEQAAQLGCRDQPGATTPADDLPRGSAAVHHDLRRSVVRG